MKKLLLLAVFAVFFASCSDDKEKPIIPNVNLGNNSKLEFTHETGKQNITLESNVSWELSTTDSWITVTPMSGVAGEHTIEISVTAYEEVNTRKGTIKVTAEGLTEEVKIEITQVGPGLIVNPEEVTLSSLGEEKEFIIYCGGSWTISGVEEWMTLNKAEGTGKDTIRVSALMNTTGADREGTLTVTSGTNLAKVTVKQVLVDLQYDVTAHIVDEKFKAIMLGLADKNADGKITLEEALTVTAIKGPMNERTHGVTDFSGLEFFTNLTFIRCVAGPTQLNVSTLTKLDTLVYNQWSNPSTGEITPGITGIDLSNCKELLYLELLRNELTELNLEHNPKLFYLNVNYNKLTNLTLSDEAVLGYVSCAENDLQSLKINKLRTYEYYNGMQNVTSKAQISINNNSNFDPANLTITDKANLGTLNISGTKLTNWAFLSTYGEMESLTCSDCNLIEIDLPAITITKTFSCGSNPLTKVDISKANIYELNFSGKAKMMPVLQTLNLSTSLQRLSLSFVELTNPTLDISNTGLVYLYLANSKGVTGLKLNSTITTASIITNTTLTSLDASMAANLNSLTCTGNALTDLKLNNALTTLTCSNNSLTSLDLSSMTNLKSITCSGNSMTELKVNGTALTSLNCSKNKLDTIQFVPGTISLSKEITTINCSENLFTNLQFILDNTKVKQLTCNKNDLDYLDISRSIGLTKLVADENDFTVIYVPAASTGWTQPTNSPPFNMNWVVDSGVTTAEKTN